MDKEKSIFAQNLILLRKSKKLTQLELAEVLNYSDKSVSKWEKGDAEPDLDTLIGLSNFFNVTLDELCKTELTEEQLLNKQEDASKKRRLFTTNKILIICLTIVAVWFIAVFTFIQAKLNKGEIYWMAFIWAIPASFLALTIFCSIWGGRKSIFISSSFLVWTVLMALHLNSVQMGYKTFWILYFLGIPLQISIILGMQFRFRRK